MSHIDQETLELYVLRAGEVEAQRPEIEDHLKSCAGCAALCQEITEYYDDVEKIEAEQRSARSQALTVRSLLVSTPPFPSADPLSERRKTVPARFVLFVIRHPVVSSFGFMASFAAALFALFSLATQKDSNPMYARAKDDFLVVMNKEGQELWKRYVAAGFDREALKRNSPPYEPDSYVATIDVDGDGRNEVILVSGMLPPHNSIVRCFHSDGNLRWEYELHRDMVFGNETMADKYLTTAMTGGDLDGDGRVEVYVIASHAPYYPNVLLKLDARDGKLLGEYWHAGSLAQIRSADMDGDGIAELIITGTNNGLNLASVVVLDPRFISGHGPAPLEYTPQGVQAGLEKFYLTFSRSDVAPFAEQKRNLGLDGVRLTDDLLQVSIAERFNETWVPLVYELNDSMRCIRVAENDLFTQMHQKLKAQGKVTSSLDSTYYEDLRKGVRYWDGKKFVETPTMNKRYVDALASGKFPAPPPQAGANPSYATAEKEFLVVYNKAGKELWRKHVGLHYDQEYLVKNGYDPTRFVAIADVDKDGGNEVLAVYGFGTWPDRNSVFCYDASGNVRWRYEVHRNMTFGTRAFADDYVVYMLSVGDFDNEGVVDVLVAAGQTDYHPSVLIKLRGSNGQFVSEYWNSGRFRFRMKDIDGDGITEAVLYGDNNGFNLGSLIVLDPRSIAGYGNAPPEFTPQGIPPGREKFHILIARSDIQKFVNGNRNTADILEFPSGGGLTLWTRERQDSEGGARLFSLIYHFTPRLECQSVAGADDFTSFYGKLKAEGKVTRPLDAAYYEDLRKSLLYWDGQEFVAAPTINRRYHGPSTPLP